MKTKTEEDIKSEKDTITIAVVIGVGLTAITFCFDSFTGLARISTLVDIIFCFIVGNMGRRRKIGFGPSFYLSLFFLPIVGAIFTLVSPRLRDEEYKEKMLEMTTKAASAKTASVADELLKLNELRKDGALTDEEFLAQKEKLLSV